MFENVLSILFKKRISLINIFMIIILLTIFSSFTYFRYVDSQFKKQWGFDLSQISKDYHEHQEKIEKFFAKREAWNTSNLGSIIFKNGDKNEYLHNNNITYKVLVYRDWNWLKKRHLKMRSISELLQSCSVSNCVFTGNDTEIIDADAVVINTMKKVIPSVQDRNPKQIWIFLNDETPVNMFNLAGPNKRKLGLEDLGGIFNWTMTYRHSAEIPVPYGRTVARQEPVNIDLEDAKRALENLVPFWKQKQFTTLPNILMSNCRKWRMDFLSELKKYMKVDVFGRCANKFTSELKQKCPVGFHTACDIQESYLFYLVLENTKCREYMTEKLFYNAYFKGAIPIIAGPPMEDCQVHLPPDSFLHIDNYRNLSDLARDITIIAKSHEELLKYHAWRKNFKILNEHGYFGTESVHYCRICEALNYNDRNTSVIDSKKLLRIFDKHECI